jgi:hypothetical protein
MTQKLQTPFLYLALGITQAIHSTEEYLTRLYDWFPVVTGYIHNVTGFFPIITMGEQTFVVINIALITFLLSISPFVFQNKHWAYKVAKVAAVVEILNGFAHISAAIYVGGYYPGFVSAIGLLVVGTLLMRSFFKGQSNGV